jgi:type VI secretion system protein ImpA
MNERVEKLLAPISAEQPCGPDLSDDPLFDELQKILRGIPEVEIGNVQKPAQPPEWRELKGKSEEFLGRSKDLRVALMWCGSGLKLEGLPGFRDGLLLIRGLMEQHWAALHPLLDPEDNDPMQRLNILSTLTVPRGAADGWLKFVDYLYAAPVCQRRGFPAIIFEPLLAVQQSAVAGGPPVESPEFTEAAAAIRAGGAEQVAAHRQTLEESSEALKAIDAFLTTTLGSGGTISFEEIEKTLAAMIKALAPFLPNVATAGEAEAGAAGEAADASSGAGGVSMTIRGQIRSREDVVRQLEAICEYYRQVEPSSPVPFLLRRAQKVVNMSFVQVVQELNVGSPDSMRPTLGGVVDEPVPPA